MGQLVLRSWLRLNFFKAWDEVYIHGYLLQQRLLDSAPISMVDFTGVNYASEGARIWDNFYAVCEKDACTFTEPSSMYVHSHMVLFRMTAHR